jgi:hypothetical protein
MQIIYHFLFVAFAKRNKLHLLSLSLVVRYYVEEFSFLEMALNCIFSLAMPLYPSKVLFSIVCISSHILFSIFPMD